VARELSPVLSKATSQQKGEFMGIKQVSRAMNFVSWHEDLCAVAGVLRNGGGVSHV